MQVFPEIRMRGPTFRASMDNRRRRYERVRDGPPPSKERIYLTRSEREREERAAKAIDFNRVENRLWAARKVNLGPFYYTNDGGVALLPETL